MWSRLARPRPRALGAGPILVAAALGLAGCGADTPTAPAASGPLDLALPWERGDAEALGMDVDRLRAAADAADDIPRVQSLMVVRQGRVVTERYYDGFPPDSLADVRSVTKSVVSTLVGIALDRGDLPGLDATLDQLLPDSVASLPEAQRGITVGHLLTMTGGWAWQESGTSAYNDWILSGDHVGHLLEQGLAHTPGTTFTYNSPAVHLLGVVLQEAVGSLPVYAETHLFGPLGIGRVQWESLPGGRVNGGAGLDLRTEDLARFGQLMLQGGVSGTRQVVPADFVAQATARRLDWEADIGPTRMSYGYLWWTDETHDAFFAWGHRGQFVYVAPDRELVVVVTTGWRRLPDEPLDRPNLQLEILGHVIDQVVPAAPVVR